MSSSSLPYTDRAPAVLIVTATTLALASVFVAARLVTRLAIVKRSATDDYAIVLAWLFAFGTSFSVAYATRLGLGRRDADIEYIDQAALTKCEYASSLLYNPALMATRTSILVFYLRLSVNQNKFFRILSYVTLAVTNIGGLVLTLLNAFQCHPMAAMFDSSADIQCIPLITLYLVSSPFNIVVDLVILLLPMPILTGMRLPRKQKNVLIFTFGLGVFVAVVDVIRIYYLQKAMDERDTSTDSVGMQGLGDRYNLAYNISLSLMWTCVEVNLALVCACVPILKPLARRIHPRLIMDHVGHDSSHEFRLFNNAPADHPPSAGTAAAAAVNARPGAIRRGAGIDELDFHTVPDGYSPNAADFPSSDLLGELPNGHHAADAPSGSQTATGDITSGSDGTVYFGFVNMQRPKSMLKLPARQSLIYCSLVTIFFFLWGFSYGLLDSLNARIVDIAHFDRLIIIGLQSAYFGAYPLGALTVGRYALVHHSFKVTFICGLCTYGVGTLMFWPSAVLKSFWGFLFSNFVTGFGLSVLETAANPFLALCGPPAYAEARLLTAQAVQALASLISDLIAKKAYFAKPAYNSDRKTPNDVSLIDVQWTYLAIALLTVILGIIFFYMPLPEATDDDLAAAAEQPALPVSKTQPRYRMAHVVLVIGAIATFFTTTAQEGGGLWSAYMVYSSTLQTTPVTEPRMPVDNYSFIGKAGFAVARLLAAGLCLVTRPRFVLAGFLACALLLGVVFIAVPESVTAGHPDTVAALFIAVSFCEAPLFPLIFALTLRRLGRATKTGAAFVASGMAGGVVGPWCMYGAEKSIGPRRAFCVGVVALLMAGVFPVFLCTVKEAKAVVDWEGEGNGKGENKWRRAKSKWRANYT